MTTSFRWPPYVLHLSFSGFTPYEFLVFFHCLEQKSEKYFKDLCVRQVVLELLLSHWSDCDVTEEAHSDTEQQLSEVH